MGHDGGGVNVETAQDPFELERLLHLVAEKGPRRILEIGVWHGGTLWHWLQLGQAVVAVDDTMFEADDWQAWADACDAELSLLQGDSHHETIVEAVRAAGPYDLVFIDAAHDYQSVRTDWENYGDMVADDGLVVFHDIQPRDGYGVSDLWAELAPGRCTAEFWGGTPAYCGIGVIFT